jgi:hypothetical protein
LEVRFFLIAPVRSHFFFFPLRISPVPRSARRKDVYDILAPLQYDPRKLYAKYADLAILCVALTLFRYNVNYSKLDDWYIELASVEEGKKLAERRLYVTGRLARALPVTADIYMLEKDKNIGFEGGRAILLNGVRT